MRYVHLNRPFVVRGAAKNWDAVLCWSPSYLRGRLGNAPVNVALTPQGNADSVLQLQDESLCFVKPLEMQESFEAALTAIQEQELAKDGTEGLVRYLQTQNDNLRGEYSDIFKDVPRDIPFARIALQKDPEAINFWLGSSRSTTALHKDNYENIYVQILGQKHFVLLAPVEAACVNQQELRAATYAWSESEPNRLEVQFDQPPAIVPFPTWDPDLPYSRSTFASRLSQPIRVALNPGDMLYLPARWFHKVRQSCNEDAICVAVNYWYDMEFSGAFHSLTTFVQDTGRLALDKQR